MHKKEIQLAIIFTFGLWIGGTTDANVGDDLRRLLDAIRIVETGGEPNEGRDAVGDGGRAIGGFQIWRSYWKDAVEFDPSIGGEYKDCRNVAYARRVVFTYWIRYCSRELNEGNLEVLSRVHHAGPNGHKKEFSKNYWTKVKRVLSN